jgi:hypothetical protein
MASQLQQLPTFCGLALFFAVAAHQYRHLAVTHCSYTTQHCGTQMYILQCPW